MIFKGHSFWIALGCISPQLHAILLRRVTRCRLNAKTVDRGYAQGRCSQMKWGPSGNCHGSRREHHGSFFAANQCKGLSTALATCRGYIEKAQRVIPDLSHDENARVHPAAIFLKALAMAAWHA